MRPFPVTASAQGIMEFSVATEPAILRDSVHDFAATGTLELRDDFARAHGIGYSDKVRRSELLANGASMEFDSLRRQLQVECDLLDAKALRKHPGNLPLLRRELHPKILLSSQISQTKMLVMPIQIRTGDRSGSSGSLGFGLALSRMPSTAAFQCLSFSARFAQLGSLVGSFIISVHFSLSFNKPSPSISPPL